MPSDGGKKGKDMIVKKLVSLMMLVVLVGFMTGDVFAAPKKNTNKRETTKTSAKLNAKPTKAAKAAPSKSAAKSTATSNVPEIMDMDAFVQENLPKQENADNSKYFKENYVSELTGEIAEAFHQTRNYMTMPEQYRVLAEANQDNYYRPDGKSGDDGHIYVYSSRDFSVTKHKGRMVIYHYKLDASKMMAVFEPVLNAKPTVTIPDALMRPLSKEEKEYTKTLLSVVNENISFLFDVPNFVPDMDRFNRGDYAGKFVPRKYMLTDEKKLKKLTEQGLVDSEKEDIYTRWGWPVYDVSKVETGEIVDHSGCSYYSEYKRIRYVNPLILLNLDSFEPEHKTNSLNIIWNEQKEQMEQDFDILGKAPSAELEALEKAGKATPGMKNVIAEIEKKLKKKVAEGRKLIGDKKDIYMLSKPNEKPKKFKKVYLMGVEYTSGRQKERAE